MFDAEQLARKRIAEHLHRLARDIAGKRIDAFCVAWDGDDEVTTQVVAASNPDTLFEGDEEASELLKVPDLSSN